MSDVAVLFDQVSKKFSSDNRYLLRNSFTDIVKNTIGINTHSDTLRTGEFWALENISFTLREGDTLGLLGANGSGKSTILKLISGLLAPDTGNVVVNGRIGPLLEIGAGFHPILSGIENIYINGSILGMSKSEIDHKIDSIIEFADIGKFIYSPIKTYSSGMTIRLGFAIAVHSNADIFLMDEILAVGDKNFQVKCYQRMHELKKKNNTSFIIASHEEYIIKEFTEKCVVLSKGKLEYLGKSDNALSIYINSSISKKNNENRKSLNNKIVTNVVFRDKNGKKTNKIYNGDKIIVEIVYDTKGKIIKNPIFGVDFYNSHGLFITGVWSSYEKITFKEIQGRGKVLVTLDPFNLPIDTYNIDISVCIQEGSNLIQWSECHEILTVLINTNTIGLVKLNQTWKLIHTTNERGDL